MEIALLGGKSYFDAHELRLIIILYNGKTNDTDQVELLNIFYF